MVGQLTLTILLTSVGVGIAFVKWDGLRVTWCYDPNEDPEYCYQSIPRTVNEALAKGWHEVKSFDDGCKHHGRFHGRRFIKGDDVAVTPLFDVNGIIAGIQMNLRKDELFRRPNPYNYESSPNFLDNSVNGVPVYSQTFYYINPSKICTVGRTEHSLQREGTGTGLWIQVGPHVQSRHLLRAPLYHDAAIEQHWSENRCVDTMGYHNYYDVPNMQKYNCSLMRPSFLIYNNAGELHGYGATGVGSMSSRNFEHPGVGAVLTGLGDMTPQCMKDFADNPGYSNMHMFFIENPRGVNCEPLVQAKHSQDLYTSPNAKAERWHTFKVIGQLSETLEFRQRK